jgi:hypothetical protein
MIFCDEPVSSNRGGEKIFPIIKTQKTDCLIRLLFGICFLRFVLYLVFVIWDLEFAPVLLLLWQNAVFRFRWR